jgi:hypothetical protein
VAIFPVVQVALRYFDLQAFGPGKFVPGMSVWEWGYQVDLCPESGNCRMNVAKLSEPQRIGIVRTRWLRDTSAIVHDALDDLVQHDRRIHEQ